MEDEGLAIRRGPKLKLVSHTDHTRSFLSFCENFEIAIQEIKTRHPIFVIEYRDHDLVLG